MREILFRGKRTDNGEWVEGFYVGDTGDGCHEICDINSGTGHRVEVDPDTVGQYTGLQDKNGKRIFEGDAVVSIDLVGRRKGYGVVEWNELFCAWHAGKRSMYGASIEIYEVIGNIHEEESDETD